MIELLGFLARVGARDKQRPASLATSKQENAASHNIADQT
jgi:hypothetical protein